ncbi:MAG: hypothetical protein AAF481_14075 [Acidobacteriota bacterium]
MTPASCPLPSQTRRWFFGYNAERLDPSSPFIAGRLLEEGDGDDLRWLASQVDEAALRAAADHPKSELSRRSRAFWQLLLDMEPVATHSEVWPLDR